MIKQRWIGIFLFGLLCSPLTVGISGCGGPQTSGVADGESAPEPELTPEQVEGEKAAEQALKQGGG